MFRFITILAFVFLGFACQNEPTTEEGATAEQAADLQSTLQGTWQTVQINVAVNSADGLDSFRSEQLSEGLWEREFNMQPPVYYFQPDQKFRRLHRTTAGEVASESRGIWNTFGDTLMLIEEEATYQYIVKYGNGRATFRTVLDWDDDGEADDVFQSLQRQISAGIE